MVLSPKRSLIIGGISTLLGIIILTITIYMRKNCELSDFYYGFGEGCSGTLFVAAIVLLANYIVGRCKGNHSSK